jgi:hypothetical protein
MEWVCIATQGTTNLQTYDQHSAGELQGGYPLQDTGGGVGAFVHLLSFLFTTVYLLADPNTNMAFSNFKPRPIYCRDLPILL